MKAVWLATVCIGATTPVALAIDLTIKSDLAQTLEINDNRDLRPKSLGTTFAPVSSLTFDVLARTPTMRFEGSGNLSYRTYFGPGAENTENGLDKSARVNFEKTTKLTTYNIGASYSVQDATTVQLAEVGRATVGGSIITQTIQGGLKHQFNRRDEFVFSALGSSVSFTAPNQNPYDSFTTTGAWTRRLSDTTSVVGLLNYYRQESTTTEITLWKASTGLNSRLSPRLTFRGSAGAVHATAVTTTGTSVLPDTLSTSGGGSSLGWIGDFLATYRLRRTTELALSAARNISPDSFGDLQQSQSVSLSLTEEVNRRFSLSFGTGYSQNTSARDGASTMLTSSATYSYRPAPEWNTSVTYRFVQRRDGNGPAQSNSITFAVRRGVTVMP